MIRSRKLDLIEGVIGGEPTRAQLRLVQRLEMQRRLGLPLLAATAAAGRRSRHGRLFDSLGDVAAADGESGHQTRHSFVNKAVYDALLLLLLLLFVVVVVRKRDACTPRTDSSTTGCVR